MERREAQAEITEPVLTQPLREVATIITSSYARTHNVRDGDTLASTLYEKRPLAGLSVDRFPREWERRAPGLKTLADAHDIRRRVLCALERAEWTEDPALRRALSTFVVVGAGPTGVELAGAIAEITRNTTRGEFRRYDPSSSRILLVDAASRVLPGFDPRLSHNAAQALVGLGVEVRGDTKVVSMDDRGVQLSSAGSVETVDCATVLWAAGVRGAPLGERVAQATGVVLDRQGRIPVQADCSIAGHPEIFVLGDLARYEIGGKELPGLAPVAIQQGRFVAGSIARRLAGRPAPAAFRYLDKGMMATIGRGASVAQYKGLRLSGFWAWLAWIFVHLMYLVGFENRVLVLLQWAWSYLTLGRNARIVFAPSKDQCYGGVAPNKNDAGG